jgi:hypothetical protein
MLFRLRRFPWVACLVGFAFSGCAGSLSSPGDFGDAAPSPSEAGGGATACAASVPTTILMPTCGESGCHDPTTIASGGGLMVYGLDLDSPDVASRLVGVPSQEVPAEDLISSTAPQSSYLLQKLKPNPSVGLQMPYAGTPLTAAQLACVEAWVDSVASGADAGAAPMDGGTGMDDGAGPDSTAATSPGDAGVPDDSGPADTGAADTGTHDTGTAEPPDAGPPTFSNLYATVFAQNGCTTHHSGGNASGDLDMSTKAKAYADLVNVKSTTPNGEKPACPAGDRVVPGSASTSLLYLTVSEAAPPCGSRMPVNGPYLTTTDQALIATWINDGAKNN